MIYLDENPKSVITACGIYIDGKQCAQRLSFMAQRPEWNGKGYHAFCPIHGANPLFPDLDDAIDAAGGRFTI